MTRRSTFRVTSITRQAHEATNVCFFLLEREMPCEMLEVVASNPSIVELELAQPPEVTVRLCEIGRGGIDVGVFGVCLESFFIVFGLRLLPVSACIRATSSVLSNSLYSPKSVATLVCLSALSKVLMLSSTIKAVARLSRRLLDYPL